MSSTRVAGHRIVSIGDGECELAVPYRPELGRPGGIVSGTAYMHAADVCFWLAIATRLGTGSLDATTSGMTTAFLSSARREGFTCRARVLRAGSRLVYGVAECVAGERLLTHHTLTYAVAATFWAAATTAS